MSKTSDDRDWYLGQGYARGGWHARFMDGVKKWDAHHAKLLKDGLLEADKEHGLYRITDAGLDRIEATKYRHFIQSWSRQAAE